MPSTPNGRISKEAFLKGGAVLTSFVYPCVLAVWGKYIPTWMVISVIILVFGFYAVAGFLHFREHGGVKGLAKYSSEHLAISVSAIVLVCCLAVGTSVYLIMRPTAKHTHTENSPVETTASTRPPSQPLKQTRQESSQDKKKKRPNSDQLRSRSSRSATALHKGVQVGDESVALGKLPDGSKIGNKSVYMGATDSHGNAIYNQPGAYGYDAHAGPGSMAVGAYSGSAGQSVGTVDCTQNSGNCAGINNGTQIVNQFGPAPMVLTDSQMSEITMSMSRFAGIKVRIFVQNATPDSSKLAAHVAVALKSAGLVVEGPYPAMFFYDHPPAPGFSISASADRMKAAQNFGNALYDARFLPTRPDFSSATPANGTGIFDITVIPNR